MWKQHHISMLIRFNKIECLFNVEVRRCCYVASTCICLLSTDYGAGSTELNFPIVFLTSLCVTSYSGIS